MKVLFSPIGGTDPITNFRDGAMLHICRHYLPDKVYLYLSKEMCVLHDQSDPYRYCIRELGKLLNHPFECEIIRRDELEEVQLFDTFVDEYNRIIQKIFAREKITSMIVNVSSGTPAMKSALLFLSAVSDGRLIPVQVSTPQKAMNPRVEEKNIQYDPAENWEVNEDNEPGKENRSARASSTNWSFEIKKEIIKKHIQAYDYVAALQIAQELDHLNEDFLTLLSAANDRMKLDLKNMQKRLNHFPFGFIPVQEGNYKMLVEYALNLQIKMKKEEYADYVRALSPIMMDLYFLILKQECRIDIEKDYSYRTKHGMLRWDQGKVQGDQVVWNALNCGYQGNFVVNRAVENGHLRVLCNALIVDENIKTKVQALSNVEEKVRNPAAPQLISVTGSSIQQLTGETPENIMAYIRFFIDRYIGKGRTGIWDSYDTMNQKLIEYLQRCQS